MRAHSPATAAPRTKPLKKRPRQGVVRTLRLAALLTAATLSALSLSRPARAALLCEHALAAAARESGVPLDILYSVGLTETGHKGVLGPYDLNIDGRSVLSETLAEALQTYARAEQSGAKFIDIGCMQINHRFHAAHFRSLEDMFDPERNVRYAAGFLKILYAQEGSWTLAVARYNAGPDNPRAQRVYVCAVIAHMVESGLGAWTPRAREFCS